MSRERKLSTEKIFRATNTLLLKHGYEGFSISLIAEELNISRAALYKYYNNKEDLILDYMLFEMHEILISLKEIKTQQPFEMQMNQLLSIIFDCSDIHQILNIAQHIPRDLTDKVTSKKAQLEALHLDMYTILQSFIDQGKKEQVLRANLPDDLILGFIFQSIDIPNHRKIPRNEWLQHITEVVRHGIFTVK